ncbi:MAG: methyltransferase family protein [Sediminispirochaetaceae bacterium]
MTTSYFIWFGICLACYSIRTVFNLAVHHRKPPADNKIVVSFIFFIMAVLWFAWFRMCFIDPVRIDLPRWIRYFGLTLFAAGVLLFILSHTSLRGFGTQEGFVTSGIYSKIRNPMYLGFILWIIGLPLFLQGLLTLASSLIWTAFLLYWRYLEEKDMEKKYSGYREYKRRTWF